MRSLKVGIGVLAARQFFLVLVGSIIIHGVDPRRIEAGTLSPLPLKRFDGQVRISFKNGFTVKGCCLRINGDQVNFNPGIPQTLPLSQVVKIEVRKSRVATAAKLAGGSCATTVLLSVLNYSDRDRDESGLSRGEFLAGGVFWTGVFAAAGGLLGYWISSWEPVYLVPFGSIREDVEFSRIRGGSLGRVDIGIKRKF